MSTAGKNNTRALHGNKWANTDSLERAIHDTLVMSSRLALIVLVKYAGG